MITAEHRLGEQELEAGNVWINGWAIIADQFEEGGFKQSGVGRDLGMAAMEGYTELKNVYVAIE